VSALTTGFADVDAVASMARPDGAGAAAASSDELVLPGAPHLRRSAALRRRAVRALQRSAVLALWDLVAVQVVVVAAWLLLALGLLDSTSGAGAVADAIAGWLLPVVVVGALALSGGYRRGSRPRLLLARVATFAVAVVLATAPVASLASLLPAALVTVVLLAMALGASRAMGDLFVRGVWPGRSAVPQAIFVGSRDEYRAIAAGADGRAGRDHRVVAWLGGGLRRSTSVWRKLGTLEALIEKFDAEAVIVGASVPQHRLRLLRDLCLAAGCELLYPIPSVRLAGTRARVVWRYEQPYLAVGDAVLRPEALVLKRIADLIGAVVGMVLLAPLLAAIAIGIRLDSPGPVLFVQDRAGFGGARFRMLKFRTMRAGADDEKDELAHLNHTGDSRLFKIPDDPRVTRFGRWLRRWSLDELPQLWNVLVGDMSLVGPRPFFARDLAAYEDHHFHRLGAKPGITGLWQVSGRSTIVDFEEVVRLDREYIEGWSLALDLSILARTVPAVLSRTGAC
jgi:exopolysaccharide biosynthesis polyprenyl glycosylphosphotransferase